MRLETNELVTSQISPIEDWSVAISAAIINFIDRLLLFIPALVAAIVIFIVGWILAVILAAASRRLLEAVGFNKAADRAGVDTFLQKAGIKMSPSGAVAGLVKWFVILVFFVAAVNVLGLPAVSDVLNNILLFIPNVIAAILILTVGIVLANFVSDLVKGALATAKVGVSGLLASISRWAIIVFAVLAALNQLNIAQDLINILFLGVVATFALGVGLAIGLGGKDVVGRTLSEWYEKMRKK
jgi:hypothetical protein